jgi:hypothetical protein
MHAVIRNYSSKGAKELFDIFEKHKAEAEGVMRPIKGFVSYLEARTADGGFTDECSGSAHATGSGRNGAARATARDRQTALRGHAAAGAGIGRDVGAQWS